MHLNRQARIQLAIFTVIAVLALTLMAVNYMKLPAKLFGIGRYTVSLELPRAAGLYATGNVTYRGTPVGQVNAVRLTESGVVAELSLKSDVDIPSDLTAQVHSQSAIGEQYVELVPRSEHAPPLRNGDVIPVGNTSVPRDINSVLDAVRSGLQAIPHDNVKTVIDESYTAVGGLGPQLAAIVDNGTQLTIDARANLDPMLALLDNSAPVLDSQTGTSDSIRAWASNVATVTQQLRTHDRAVAGVIDNGGPAMNEARQLIDRVTPTLPVLLANLVSVSQVGVTYRNDLEQILVLLPQLISVEQGTIVANTNTQQNYKGAYLSFNLNVNLPPPCNTGYLPAQQVRSATMQDYPPRPPGDLYCRVPQDSPFNVRGARNIPCETVPGKRAATVAECESDHTYVPLNDGYNWKGDPNATYTGQSVPEPPPVAVAQYDPRSGSYIGPDGKQYRQSDLAQPSAGGRTWQSMVLPPPS